MRNLVLATLLIAVPCISTAQSTRSQNWEVSVSAIFQDSKSIGGSFIKASYNYWEMDGLGKAEDSAFEAGRIEFGWGF